MDGFLDLKLLHHSSIVDWYVVPVENPFPTDNVLPLLLETVQEHGEGTYDVVCINIMPMLSKNTSTICLVLNEPRLALFYSLLDCGLVSGVWKNTMDSSIVTILSRIDKDLSFISFIHLVQLPTLSNFWSDERSLGAHLSLFLTSAAQGPRE